MFHVTIIDNTLISLLGTINALKLLEQRQIVHRILVRLRLLLEQSLELCKIVFLKEVLEVVLICISSSLTISRYRLIYLCFSLSASKLTENRILKNLRNNLFSTFSQLSSITNRLDSICQSLKGTYLGVKLRSRIGQI